MKILTTYFSATNTTETIVKEIAKKIGQDVQTLDITSTPLEQDIMLSATDLLLVGMPVYAGRIPAVAIESLQHLKGNHTPVILVAVYGNREFDDVFVEMQDILESNGFYVIAGGAFVAQHSIFPQTAHGRPDASDFKKMEDFALRCKDLVAKRTEAEVKSITLPGNRPYKIPGNIPLKVTTGKQCTECMVCVKVCPVQAIPTDNPHITDYDKCIHCGRCIHVCSTHARQYKGLLYKVAGTVFSWKNRQRKEPQFFF